MRKNRAALREFNEQQKDMKKFTQEIVMKVTKEQFEEDLKQPLLDLGYRDDKGWNKIHPIGVNNYDYVLINNKDENESTFEIHNHECLGAYMLGLYNPELFLALAAMTEGEDWIVGEWLMCTEECIKLGGVKNPVFKVKERYGCNDIIGCASNEYKQYYRKATKEELINHFTIKPKEMSKENRFPFRLEEEDARRIINIACSEWKVRLAQMWAADLLIEGKTVVTIDFYKAMRKECTAEQNALFDDIFGTDEKHIPEGTLCLVRDSKIYSWNLVYANGKGEFYVRGKKQGATVPWKYVHILNGLNNLPIDE